MTVNQLDFFNPNTYYSFFIDPLPSYESYQISHQYLSKFEAFCKQGDIHALDELTINHDALTSENNFLNGLILTIKFKHRGLFQTLIQMEKYKAIILRHLPTLRNAIFHQGQLRFLLDLQRLFHHDLNLPNIDSLAIQLALNQLQTYYHTRLRTLHRNIHVKNIKDKVAQCYQKQKAFFLVPLPLEYEAFMALKGEYSEPMQQQILKAYKNHSIHKLWRLLHPNQSWFEDSEEQEIAKVIEQNQWLIILMWLAASDELFLQNEQVDIQTLEDRIEFFFENLSLLKSSEHLLAHLFQAVIAHPFTLVLNKNILILEHEQFISNLVVTRINSSHKDYLNHIMTSIQTQETLEKHEGLKQILHLSESDLESFYTYMSDKWGAQWTQNSKLQTESYHLLSYSQILNHHSRPILSLLKSHHSYDKNHSFRFFYNSNTKSSNPKTNDFLLPLS